MTLIVPGGTENTITDTYLKQFWSESCGFTGCEIYRLYDSNYPGWHHDTSFVEVTGPNGSHGGCSYCIMTLSQMLANYQTEITFISNPPGAHIFIDGAEWWPGTVTAADGATFIGIPPTVTPATHSYEMKIDGYLSTTGAFGLIEGTPTTVSGTLYLLTSLGNATIESIPVGAEIWLAPTEQTLVDQGVVTVQGGTTISNLLEGSYDYKLTLTGFQDALGSFDIIGGQTLTTTVTLSEIVPANIAATAITPSITTCTAPCNMTVDITWTNNGGTSGTFIPTITVNGTVIALSEESLDPSLSITKTFPLTGLIAGTYNICSLPNTFPCAMVIVLTPANIVSTAITPSITTCTEPCNPTVNITWTNTGETSGSFTPTIVVDEISIPLAMPETLDPAQSVTKTFTVTDLMKGSHNICANPDTGVGCITITVEQVAQAGFGATGMIIVAGLVIGAIYSTKKKSKMEK